MFLCVSVLTRPLLLLLEVLFVFVVLRLRVEVVVAVLRELPLVALVRKVGGAAGQVHAELLDVDLHDADMYRHSNLWP